MSRLAFVILLNILGETGANVSPTSTLPGNTTVTPQTSSVIVQTPTPVSPGRKLKCYSCPETTLDYGYYSNKGKCYIDFHRNSVDQRRTEEECPSSNYMCGRATYSIRGQKYIYRGCINMTRCSGQEYCRMDQNKSRCDVSCCGWDLCNGAMDEAPHQCYYCILGDDNCHTGATKCSSGDDLCLKVKIKDDYFKSCINQAGCYALRDECKNKDCSVYCCYGNLCNSGIILSKNNGTLLVTLSLFLLAAIDFLQSP